MTKVQECPFCDYTVSTNAPIAPCPECGADPYDRQKWSERDSASACGGAAVAVTAASTLLAACARIDFGLHLARLRTVVGDALLILRIQELLLLLSALVFWWSVVTRRNTRFRYSRLVIGSVILVGVMVMSMRSCHRYLFN